MTLHAGRPGGLGGRPGNAAVYRHRFVRTVHDVLAAGYSLLRPADLAASAEPAITGLLVECMRRVLESRACPPGAEHFAIHDDPPQAFAGTEGNRRPRVDIVVERAEPGRRPRFHFEAKRLVSRDSTNDYVGGRGMGRFLSGRYASDEASAGMLGYVQVESPETWASRLGAAIGSSWTRHEIDARLRDTFRSHHLRAGQPFELFHVLLVCL